MTTWQKPPCWMWWTSCILAVVASLVVVFMAIQWALAGDMGWFVLMGTALLLGWGTVAMAMWGMRCAAGGARSCALIRSMEVL